MSVSPPLRWVEIFDELALLFKNMLLNSQSVPYKKITKAWGVVMASVIRAQPLTDICS